MTDASPSLLRVTEKILEVTRELALARDLQSVIATVTAAARSVSGADGVTFVLREEGLCHYADEDAIAPLWKGRRFPMDACISGWVLRRGEPVTIPDIRTDPRIPQDAYRVTFVRSLAMVPVRTPDPVAAIGAYWATSHVATDAELRALQMLADSAALALTNVWLYDELRAALARQEQALEEQLRARRDAEAATKAKDHFLAIVAHELRQPLSAATAALSVLRMQTRRAGRVRAQSVLERQVFRMTRLVEDLLDASRIVRGEITLQTRPLDLRDVVQRAVETTRPAIDARAHRLSLQLAADACLVDGDAARLEQVLVNLLQNAARYTPEGGVIEVSVEDTAGDVAVRVRDTGEGIPADKLSAIFGLFTRGSENPGGFGIGLAVARRLIEEHGGTIEAHSSGVGQGSEFVVRLPCAAALGQAAGA